MTHSGHVPSLARGGRRQPILTVVVGTATLAQAIDRRTTDVGELRLAGHCTTITQACEIASVQPVDVVLVEAAHAEAASDDLQRARRTHRNTVFVVGDTPGAAAAVRDALRAVGRR